MPTTTKVSISLPEEVLERVERWRRVSGESRSELFRRALGLLFEGDRTAGRRNDPASGFVAEPAVAYQADTPYAGGGGLHAGLVATRVGYGYERWYGDTMIATIDKAGRVVVPVELRERLGMTGGTQLEISIDERGLRFRRAVPGPELVRRGSRIVARPTAAPEALPEVDVARLVEAERDRWPA